jgi:UDP-glucuronate decarboxylase
MNLYKKNILVTGGAGFIGANLCRKLLKQNNYVICLDNLISSKKTNIQKLLDKPNFQFIKGDILNLPKISEVQEIYNLACAASPPLYQKNSLHTLKTSVLGSTNLLELAIKNKAKILQASSSEVYGDPLIHPQKENYWGNVNILGPRSCYDEGKRCAETMFFEYHRTHNIEIKIVRIFNTYGPSMNPNDGRVISNFINQAIRNQDITIYGDGSQTRSFQYVDDLIEGMIRMMASDKEFIGPINLGNPNELTIQQLAEEILELTSSRSKIIFNNLPVDDPKIRKPDIELANKKLNGWSPKIELKEGLVKTIEYYQGLKDYDL